MSDLKMNAPSARRILRGGDPAYRVVVDDIEDHGRWSLHHRLVIQRVEDGAFFETHYSDGATEEQYEEPWDYGDPEFHRVVPVERVVVVYERAEVSES